MNLFGHLYTTFIELTPLNSTTLGPVKSGSNSWRAQFSEEIYCIILQIRTTEGGSFKRFELTGELLTAVYCIPVFLSLQVFLGGNVKNF